MQEKQLAQVDFAKYDKILFVSKSIGTAVAAAYQQKHADTFQEKEIKNVYLTPMEKTFDFHLKKGIAFSGTKDPGLERDIIKEKCKENEINLTIIDEVNHSLEREDVFQNLAIMQNVMKKIDSYLFEEK